MTTQRAQFVATATRMLEQNPKVIVLLADISVFAFREAAERFPGRVINVGVSEQAMVSMGAGLARAGLYPIMHTIDPFAIGRAYDQLKVDFGYNNLSGAIVTVGASTDYSALGPTHHGPESVALMLTIPGSRIHVPGHVGELDRILDAAPEMSGLTYIRLSEDQNPGDMRAQAFLSAAPDSVGEIMVVAVGPALRLCPKVEIGGGVNLLYLATVQPFPWLVLQQAKPKKVLLVEPFYTGTLTHLVTEALYPDPVTVMSVGVPRKFLREYGTRAHLDQVTGLTSANVARHLELLRAA